MWVDLARASGGRGWLYAGRPVLVVGGRVVAAAWGTTYVIRLPAGVEAPQHPPAHRWGGGTVTDVADELGPDWRFGNWDPEEGRWLASFSAA